MPPAWDTGLCFLPMPSLPLFGHASTRFPTPHTMSSFHRNVYGPNVQPGRSMAPRCYPPPLQSPPGGGRLSFQCFAGQYTLQWSVFPISRTHVLALLSHSFKSVACVYSVILSLQRRCTRCRVPFSDPRCFLPGTVYGTTHAHLVHMYWPLLWSLYTKWAAVLPRSVHTPWWGQVDHGSAQLSRLEAVVVASPKSPVSPDITPMASQPQTPAVCLHQWRVPQFALKYLCNPPPPRGETVTW